MFSYKSRTGNHSGYYPLAANMYLYTDELRPFPHSLGGFVPRAPQIHKKRGVPGNDIASYERE